MKYLIALIVGIAFSIAYVSIGYNSEDTITIIWYGEDERNIRIISAAGFYKRFGNTDYEIYKRTKTSKADGYDIVHPGE